MSESKKDKQIIGRAEIIRFPEMAEKQVHARIDSGAKTSAIWGVTRIENDQLIVTFFNEPDCEYTFTAYSKVMVSNSSGHTTKRYAVRLAVVIKGRKVRATFTIADRSTQVYPVLIGRNVLRGKFIVDVTLGKVLSAAEKEKTASLRTLLEKEELL